jgi:hypothetical protein
MAVPAREDIFLLNKIEQKAPQKNHGGQSYLYEKQLDYRTRGIKRLGKRK